MPDRSADPMSIQEKNTSIIHREATCLAQRRHLQFRSKTAVRTLHPKINNSYKVSENKQ